MSKVIESLYKDILEKVKSPEVQSAVVEPLLSYILDLLYPYLIAIVGLWIFILLGIFAILIFLLYLVS